MTLILHTLVCVAALFALSIPYMLLELLPWSSVSHITIIIMLAISIIMHITLIFSYYKKGYNLFALPLSHVLFPVILYAVLHFMRSIIQISVCPAGWEAFAVVIAVYYMFPIAGLTLFVSIIIKKRG